MWCSRLSPKQLHWHGASMCCLWVVLFVAPLLCPGAGVAETLGDTYTVSGTNFPDTYSDIDLTFDGTSEVAGGMSVTESLQNFNGISGGVIAQNVFGVPFTLTAWEGCGRLIEITWSTAGGGFIAGTPGLAKPSDLLFQDLDVENHRRIVPTGLFITFRRNGAGVTYDPDPSLFEDPNLLLVGPHPSQPGTQTLYLNVPSQEISSFLMIDGSTLHSMFDTEYFGQSVGFFEMSYALGLLNPFNIFGSAQSLNGISVGVLLGEVLEADFNLDGQVDLNDLGFLQSRLGATGPNVAGDLNHDGVVNRGDVIVFLSQYGKSSDCLPQNRTPAAASAPALETSSSKKPALNTRLLQRRLTRELTTPPKTRRPIPRPTKPQ